MTNKLVARQLRIAGDLLVLTGGNAFRARAFSSASRTVDRMDEPVASYDVQELTTVRGIGKGLAADIREIVETGTLGAVESMLQSLPPGLPEVMRVKGLGPKKVRVLWQELDITSLDDLEQSAASGALEALPGFGAKTVANILASIEKLKAYRGMAHYGRVVPDALAARDALRASGARADLTGSIRRQCNVLDGADLLTDATPEAAESALTDYSVRDGVGTLSDGLPLRVHITPEAAYGTHLWRTTGSDEHLRLWRERFGEPGDVRDEAEIFEAAGVEVIPAPIREGTWEVEAAATGSLPTLVTHDDIRGTLHNHSTWSDGVESVEAMAEAARARGWTYYGIGDHSRSLQIAHGLSIEQLRDQMDEAAEINARYEASGVDMRVLTGSECDILQDGTMDFPDEVLAELDVVVASVHLKLEMSEAEATERVVRAVSSPHVDILGHATGRLLLRRDGYPLDVDAVLDACAEHHTAVELNANPWRLDMDWRFLRDARDRGIPVSINPDAHTIDGLDDTQWGVASAQKAGLEAGDILNARSRDALHSWIRSADS